MLLRHYCTADGGYCNVCQYWLVWTKEAPASSWQYPYTFCLTDAAVNAGAGVKTPVKRTISTGDATKTQILQVTANPNSSAPDTKKIKLEATAVRSVAAEGAADSAGQPEASSSQWSKMYRWNSMFVHRCHGLVFSTSLLVHYYYHLPALSLELPCCYYYSFIRYPGLSAPSLVIQRSCIDGC